MNSFEAGQIVEFKLGGSSQFSGRGVVLESVQKENASEWLEIALLSPQEEVESGVIANRILSGKRQMSVVPLSSVSATDKVLSQNELGKIWQEITQHAAYGHYKTVHKPKADKPFKVGDRIPYAGRVFDDREIFNLIDSSLEFWLTAGRYSDKFESDFAKFLGVRKALLVNSGSSANLVAFATLTSPQLKDRQIKKGDEIITVAAGFPTTIAPAIQYGAVPVFVDVSLPTYNIDVSKLEEARSDKTKAVMVAHALGNPFDLAAVKSFCDKYNLWLIEDNCDALGAEYFIDGQWKLTGTIGDLGTSSFYPPHHMTMGEGGAVYTNSAKLDKIAASFRDWGRDCWCKAGVDNTCGKRFCWDLGELPKGYDHKYIYSHFGYNLKATDMQAAIGCSQIEKINSFVEARRRNWQYIRDNLSELEEFFILPEPTANSKPSWFGFLLSLRETDFQKRSQIVQQLESHGIQTRMLFAGNFLRHPVFNELKSMPGSFRVVGELKNSDYIMNNSFWLGVYPGLSQDMLAFIVEKIKEVVHTSKSIAA